MTVLRKASKTLLVLAGLSLAVLGPFCQAASAATVLSIGDGDTISVLERGQKLKVRLACIDAPETAQSPYGMASRNQLKALLPLGSTVSLRVQATVLGDDELNFPSGPEARGWLEIGDLDHRGHQLQNDLPRQIQPEIERLAHRIQKLLDAGWRSVKVVTDHGWLFCPDGLPTAELPKHLTASKWARCAAIKGGSQVPVPTAAWSWNPSEQFATPSGAACFNTGDSYSYAHGGISLQECLTPVLVVSGGASSTPAAAITEISWKGMRCNLEVSGGTAGMTADLRRDAAGGPSVATTPKPIDDGGARLLVEDDELEGAAVVAVLLSSDGRVIVQRRTVVGGEA